MNPLPQRKKSPEEIATLRQSLGIPPASFAADAEEDWPNPPPPQDPYAPSPERPPDAMAPLEDAPRHAHARQQVHSFRRSERGPEPQVEVLRESPARPEESGRLPQPTVLPVAPARQSRPLRSLKKSEHVPAPATAPAPSAAESKLPVHRHSEQELAEARRRDALAVISKGTYQLPRAAHPLLLALGYVLAIGGAAAPVLLDGFSRLSGSYTLGLACGSGYHLLTGCTLAALPVAAFIYVKTSLSRHHAAFIAIIVFFALVFAVLHYFPLLRHAT